MDTDKFKQAVDEHEAEMCDALEKCAAIFRLPAAEAQMLKDAAAVGRKKIADRKGK